MKMNEAVERTEWIEGREEGEFVEAIEADNEGGIEADGDTEENEHEHDEEGMGHSGEREE
jgi:hypothetical protein